MMRLNKYLAASGVASRRKCETIVREGSVKVNGLVTNNPFYQLQNDDIVSLGETVVHPSRETYVFVLNKPLGVITTVEDTHGRPSVLDLVKSEVRLFPVGRLDKDTSGVLLLTNNGNLAYRLTHPKFEVKKVYVVLLNRHFNVDDTEKIASGIDLGSGEIGRGKIIFHEKISTKQKDKARARIKISLSHGKKREVRRIFSSLDYQVISLHRESFAGVHGEGLHPGEWRIMAKKEIKLMMNSNEKLNS